MRLLGVLAIVAPVMIGILLVYDPNVTAPWVVEGTRSDVAALMAITLGAASTARPVVAHRSHPFRAHGQGRREDRRGRLHASKSRPPAAVSRHASVIAINGSRPPSPTPTTGRPSTA